MFQMNRLGVGYGLASAGLQAAILISWVGILVVSRRAKASSQHIQSAAETTPTSGPLTIELSALRTAEHMEADDASPVPSQAVAAPGAESRDDQPPGLSSEPSSCATVRTAPLLPCYEVVCIMKIGVNIFISMAMALQEIVVWLAEDDNQPEYEYVYAVQHLGFAATSLEIASYFPLLALLSSSAFGTHAVHLAIALGTVATLVVYGVMAGLCGYDGCAFGLACSDLPGKGAGRYLVLGSATAPASVFATALHVTMHYCSCFAEFSWRARQPELVLSILLCGVFFSSGMLVAWYFEPSSGGFSIAPKVVLLVDVFLLWHVMRHDTEYWSEVSLETGSPEAFQHLLSPVRRATADGLNESDYIDRVTAELRRLSQVSAEKISFDEMNLGQTLDISQEELGRGSAGVVYRGRHRGIPIAVKTLALRMLDSDTVKLTCYELMVATVLRHHNIVKFIGFTVSPPEIHLAMELCEVAQALDWSHAFSGWHACRAAV